VSGLLPHLPAVNALLNATSAVFLILGYRAIRAGHRETHRARMLGACAATTLFLVSYLSYHAATGTHPFRTQGAIRTLYLVVLATHTVLAAVVAPLVLLILRHAWRGSFERHRRLARWTWPAWLYVSVTGVLIYLLLYQLDPRLASRPPS